MKRVRVKFTLSFSRISRNFLRLVDQTRRRKEYHLSASADNLQRTTSTSDITHRIHAITVFTCGRKLFTSNRHQLRRPVRPLKAQATLYEQLLMVYYGHPIKGEYQKSDRSNLAGSHGDQRERKSERMVDNGNNKNQISVRMSRSHQKFIKTFTMLRMLIINYKNYQKPRGCGFWCC